MAKAGRPTRSRKGRSRAAIGVGADAFAAVVLKAAGPVLVLCMPPGSGFEDQLDLLDGQARRLAPGLTACFLEEEYIPAFRREFGVRGTPTFLMFIDGRERGRLLGQTDSETLADFVAQFMVRNGEVAPAG